MNKKLCKILIGITEEKIYLNEEELQTIMQYGKCESDRIIDIQCLDGQIIPSSQVDNIELLK